MAGAAKDSLLANMANTINREKPLFRCAGFLGRNKIGKDDIKVRLI